MYIDPQRNTHSLKRFACNHSLVHLCPEAQAAAQKDMAAVEYSGQKIPRHRHFGADVSAWTFRRGCFGADISARTFWCGRLGANVSARTFLRGHFGADVSARTFRCGHFGVDVSVRRFRRGGFSKKFHAGELRNVSLVPGKDHLLCMGRTECPPSTRRTALRAQDHMSCLAMND